MNTKRTIVWFALTAILILAFVAVGPCSSNPTPTTDTAAEEPVHETGMHTDHAEVSELIQSEDTSIDRTHVESVLKGPTIVELVESNGKPVAFATVLICSEQELLHESRTGPEGTVEFLSDGTQVTLVVAAGGRPISLHTLKLVPGKVEVQLPDGAQLTGKIIKHDGMPFQDARLILWSDNPLFDYNTLPAPARDAIDAKVRTNAIGTTTAADGTFSFTGLLASWSGFVSVPYGHTIQHASSGQLSANSSRLRLEAPPVDLVIQLAKPTNIRGRLLSSSSMAPIATTTLSALYTPMDGGRQEHKNSKTDQEGYFTLQIDPAMVDRLDLYLGMSTRQNVPFLRMTASEIPPDGELGVIHVESLRTIRFLLKDRQGVPISSGIAKAAGLSSEPTDKKGKGVLPWVPAEIASMRFVAPGFVPAEVMLQEIVPDPLIVLMDYGNRLEVELILPAGVDVSQFRATLKCDSVMIDGPAADTVELLDYYGEGSQPYYQAPGNMVGSLLVARVNHEGLIVFQSLRSDVELNLEVLGITGSTPYHQELLQPLGQQEVRRHVVDLTKTGSVFRGRVTDLNGNPLVRATVQLGGQILAWTDNLGEFSCLVKETEAKTLLASHQSSATLYMPDFLVPLHGTAVELKLEPALRVTIEVIDEAGHPIADAKAFTLRGGFTTTTHSLGGGRFETGGLSSETIGIRVQVAGKTYEQDHNPADPIAEVVVPLHGSLSVEFKPPAQPGPGKYSVAIRYMNSEEWIFQSQLLSAADDWNCDFLLVYPGEYEVSAKYSPSAEEEASGLNKAAIGEMRTVRVEAGQTSQVRLK